MNKRTPRFTKPVVETGIFNDEAGQVAMRLLQREHAAVVRKVKDDAREAVKALRATKDVRVEYLAEGQRQYCAHLLTWLNERGR